MFVPSQKIVISVDCTAADAGKLFREVSDFVKPKLKALGGGNIVGSLALGDEVEPSHVGCEVAGPTPSAA